MVSGGDVTGRDDAAVAAQTLELQEANAEELKDDTQVISKNQQKKLAKKLARKQRYDTSWSRYETVPSTEKNAIRNVREILTCLLFNGSPQLKHGRLEFMPHDAGSR